MINIEVSIVLTKYSPWKAFVQLEKLSGTQIEWWYHNPSLAEFCMGRKVGLGPPTECCWLAVTGRRLSLLPHPAKPQCCFVVRLRPELQLLVRKCLRVTVAKSHLISSYWWMDGQMGCPVKAALSASFYGASEWWIALFLLSPNHHRSKPYFSGQKPSNIKTHNQVKLLAV